MSAAAGKQGKSPACTPAAPSRRVGELEPPTQRIGNYVEIRGEFKPLDTNFGASGMVKDGKKVTR